MTTEEINPYAPPQTEMRPDNAEARAVRMGYLRMESHAKALGVLLIFGSLLAALGIYMQVRVIEREFGVLYLKWEQAFPLLSLVAGGGMCFLQRWAWILTVLYYGIMMIMSVPTFPYSIVHMLIGAVVLRFLLLANTRRLFSPDYAGIITATPELRSPVASWGWAIALLLGLFALLVAGGI